MSLPIDVEPGMRGAQGPGPVSGTIHIEQLEQPNIIGIDIKGRKIYQISGACEDSDQITRTLPSTSPDGRVVETQISTFTRVDCWDPTCHTSMVFGLPEERANQVRRVFEDDNIVLLADLTK